MSKIFEQRDLSDGRGRRPQQLSCFPEPSLKRTHRTRYLGNKRVPDLTSEDMSLLKAVLLELRLDHRCQAAKPILVNHF